MGLNLIYKDVLEEGNPIAVLDIDKSPVSISIAKAGLECILINHGWIWISAVSCNQGRAVFQESCNLR